MGGIPYAVRGDLLGMFTMPMPLTINSEPMMRLRVSGSLLNTTPSNSPTMGTTYVTIEARAAPNDDTMK